MTSVLRLGHRPERDKRMTTHVCLTARAFGAEEVLMPRLDSRVEKTITDVTGRFGGEFKLEEEGEWRSYIREWKGTTIHLTMYGEDIDDLDMTRIEDPLIIVGAEKVPAEVYDMADHNIAVGNQPHSEVAALSVFLDRYNTRKIEDIPGRRIGVLPSKEGKRVVDYDKIPSLNECYAFMIEKDMHIDIIGHSLHVLDRTLELHERYGGDLRLLTAGAMLHDIGRTLTQGVDHGVKGAEMIRKEGWEEELARIVERHVGGGITKVEAKKQGLPVRSYIPETLEEKLVCHADNTAGGRERFEDLINRVEEAGHSESAERMRKLAGEFDH